MRYAEMSIHSPLLAESSSHSTSASWPKAFGPWPDRADLSVDDHYLNVVDCCLNLPVVVRQHFNTPTSFAVRCDPTAQPGIFTLLTQINDNPLIGAEFGNFCAMGGTHTLTAGQHQHVVNIHREGGGASDSMGILVLTSCSKQNCSTSEGCAPTLLTSSAQPDESTEREFCRQAHSNRVDSPPAPGHPPKPVIIRVPEDILLNEWHLPRPPQASPSSSTPKLSASSSPLTFAPCNHGSTGSAGQVVVHPHRSSTTKRSAQSD